MSRNYKIRDQEKLYFTSFATVNWIDVFTRQEYKNIMVESINYCVANKGLQVFAWCIMTNHVHLIIGTVGKKMEEILRDLKRHTSKTILKAISTNPQESRKEWMLWMFKRAGERNPNNEVYQFWQQHNHPIEMWSNEILDQKFEYIHNNPVTAGFVEEPWEYWYSSARDYNGKKGLVDLQFIT